jgi:hypothetical protein
VAIPAIFGLTPHCSFCANPAALPDDDDTIVVAEDK